METASAAQIAALFEIPFLGIRVLSNNITNDGKYDPRTGEAVRSTSQMSSRRTSRQRLKQ